MNFEINKTKYLALVGDVQSGKTIHEINYCYESIFIHKIPVVFIIRNILADKLQLIERFKQFDFKINVKTINDSDLFKEIGVVIVLCNHVQLQKLNDNITWKRYNLCIDEVDFSIKSKNFSSKIDKLIYSLKSSANHILGATATPFAVLSSEKMLCKVKKLSRSDNYKGITDINVNYIEPVIIKNINRFPVCDHLTIKKVYSNLLTKDKSVLLHTVVKEKIFQKSLFDYLSLRWPMFTLILYNGDGITVRSNRKIEYFKKSRRYSMTKEGVHIFRDYSISQVLQLVKDDTHISIISGHLASRGISFVSTDYSLHLTDQYFHPSKSTHGENLLQSIRLLGCYNDSVELTLWCSKEVYTQIIEQYNFINDIINECKNNKRWFEKIKEVHLQKPSAALTRPKLLMGTKWNQGKNGNFNIIIEHFDPELT